MRTERQLQDYLKKIARAEKMDFYKMECVGRSGFPDVLLTWRGWSVYVELKSPAGTGRLSPRQKIMLKGLTNQGIENYVIEKQSQADALIAGIIKREPRRCNRPII
jgi:hypothetical protein